MAGLKNTLKVVQLIFFTRVEQMKKLRPPAHSPLAVARLPGDLAHRWVLSPLSREAWGRGAPETSGSSEPWRISVTLHNGGQVIIIINILFAILSFSGKLTEQFTRVWAEDCKTPICVQMIQCFVMVRDWSRQDNI